MKSFLVVDDSAAMRKIFRKMLQDTGFHVTEAKDGIEALTACGVVMPDGILLDWYMPKMNGLEFLLALRNMPGGKAPTVIFCTSERDYLSIESAMAAGADEYIMKPFDSEILSLKLWQVGLV